MMTAILCLMLGALGLGQALADVGDQKEGVLAAHRIFKAVEEGHNSPIDGLSDNNLERLADKSGEAGKYRKAKGQLVFKDISFRYPTRQDAVVCENFNLTIEAGETVALVGPSGSGKSTIMSLLLRFYNPDKGSIYMDGEEIRDINVKWLRSQIGYVGQEPVLFAGSILENIEKGRGSVQKSDVSSLMSVDAALQHVDYMNSLIGKSQVSEIIPTAAVVPSVESDVESQVAATGAVPEDVIDACKASNAHDFISTFQQGYHTDVGESSMMVSGGQKQRIAIARALIKKPAVLLLDEATSALDANSEKMVQESIDKLNEMKSQTTIIIAHRLSTIRNADKIVVVEKGQVVEIGKHDELLAKQGLYASLWNKQGGQDSK